MPDQSDAPARVGWARVDLAAIWELSRPVLEEEVTIVERAVVAGIESRLTIAAQLDAGRAAHKLAGSLGTFGFHDASRLARELELALTSTQIVDAARALELSALVVQVHADLARPAPAQTEPALRPGGTGAGAAGAAPPAVLVASADADWARRVVEAAASTGLMAQAAADLDAAVDVIAASPPDAVVVDTDVAEDAHVADFLSVIVDHEPPLTTVVISGQAGLSSRLQAVSLGASTVLARPAPPDTVARALDRLLARERRPSTVLAVDDDPTFLMIIGELLGAQGLSVEGLGDAADVWAALDRVEPDLLLLDNEMPGINGISLCRAIRSDERWERLPVVFLSGSRSAEVVRDMFDAGADDYVAKPVSAEDLVVRVVNRIERTRSQAERSGTDLATGLPDARTFARDATRLLGLARRAATPVALAVVEIDPPTASAMVAMGRLLRQAVLAEDAVGSWSGRRLAALFYGTTGDEAKQRVEQVFRSARAAGGGDRAPRASAGVSTSPDDGTELRELGVAAEVALGKARAEPGDTVTRHESFAGGRSEVVDVLLVDDDEALGALVVHAVSGRGWSVRWLQDGADAVELLDTPGFRARAVLLDVGLPGLDGLAILRHLGRRRLLTSTRVVMLTVRTNETEVLEALDLGAFDHVAKPFSLSVLLHRVRRAIEASG